jgi:hypothetical protein
MIQDGDLAQGTRTSIKLGICLLLVGQLVANYLLYLHGMLAPIRTDPRIIGLIIPSFIYIMAGTMVPDVLKKSAGIRRQTFYLADWWLAFGIWQFARGMGQGATIALFAIGALIAILSVKDAIQIEA